MLTFLTKTKVAVFVALSLATTAFLSVHYVGLDRLLGGGYRITVEMPEAGGLFKNSEVTYRGVPVGRVESLEATKDGARAVVHIESGAPEMPAEVTARVVNRSAIGEQYLDLRGGSVGNDELGDGARVTMTAADLPPAIDKLLRSSRDMVASMPSVDLNTVIDEGYEFTRGNGQNLSRLLDTSAQFAETADRNFLMTASLIDNSGKVLATQESTAASFQSFSQDMRLLAHAFAEQDADWREVIRQVPPSMRALDGLFSGVGVPLGQLMTNLISTAEVFGTNAGAVKETLIRLPEGISITFATMTSQGMRSGVQLSFFNPLPCVQGYEGTTMRPGLDTSPGKPFNTKAGCTMSPSSGVNVRGPRAVLDKRPAGSRTTTVDQADDLGDLLGGSE
ncbi:MCE family protein [Nocardioides marmoriginsengisoli]|uniref:MCE family protein n=1 Tax=Nocardioides marmoriginsengisoli TaxID=661483 RepID=A0A3N0CG55_9ACTN|nr:MlaD family protein [Nocardioides marmoriginsengisoli]RNL62427.1 MCE family protein [Nocardioides marmoriginsengisoli]